MALGSSGIQDAGAPNSGGEDLGGTGTGDVAAPPERQSLTEPSNAGRERARFSRRWLLAVPLLAVFLVAALVLVGRTRRESARPHGTVVRFTLPFPADTRRMDGAQFAPSPDGAVIALAARGPDGQSRLWIRQLRALDWQELPRTSGAMYPFWSPDSRHIGFFADRRLQRVDIESGLTRSITEAPDGHGGTWGTDDEIVFAARGDGPLARVRASGGTSQPVTELDRGRGELAHLWPRFLPDGRRFVYFATTANRSNLASYLADAHGDGRALLLPRNVAAVPVADRLLFTHNRALVAQRFDAANGRLDDHVETIAGAAEVGGGRMADGPEFSASADVLIYRNVEPQLTVLVWFDSDGRVIGEAGPAADYRTPSLSPDGMRIAVARSDASTNTSALWLLDARRGTSMRLTFGAAQDATPIWSPDSARIAFVSRREDRVVIMTTSAAGGGTAREVATSPFAVSLTDWSRDGRLLLFSARNPKTGLDIWGMPMTGDGKPMALIQTPPDESEARLSPDGRWIAYVSNESGVDQVYVRSFPASGSLWQVSTSGGAHPRWMRDGRELLFVAPDGRLMAVSRVGDESFATGTPRTLLRLDAATSVEPRQGGSFLVSMPAVQDAANQLHVIVNWTSELSMRQ
jgi:Tol biopolymer transport system component